MPESLPVLARDHCLAPGRADAPRSGGRYRSLFEDLPPAKLLLAPGGADVPRNQQGIALIGDPGNDGVAAADVFDEARRATTWHYQHVILRATLPGLIGADILAPGRR